MARAAAATSTSKGSTGTTPSTSMPVKDTENCCGRTARFLVRWLTAIVAVLGATLTGYGLYLVANEHGTNLVSITSLSIGIFDLLIGALVVWKALDWRRFLDFYVWVYGLLTLAQTVIAIIFFIPSTRENIINSIPAGPTRNLVSEHATPVGIALLVATGAQIGSIVTAYCRKRQLELRDDDAEDSNASLVTRDPEEAAEARAAATAKYRDRKAAIYEKYNIKR